MFLIRNTAKPALWPMSFSIDDCGILSPMWFNVRCTWDALARWQRCAPPWQSFPLCWSFFSTSLRLSSVVVRFSSPSAGLLWSSSFPFQFIQWLPRAFSCGFRQPDRQLRRRLDFVLRWLQVGTGALPQLVWFAVTIESMLPWLTAWARSSLDSQ